MRPIYLLVGSMCAVLLSGCEAKHSGPDAGAAASQATPIVVPSYFPVVGAFPNATEVRLFVETDNQPNGPRVFAETRGRVLTGDERKAFEATLRIEPIPDVLAACFIPHHFFAYFDPKGRKLGEISICFCCSGAGVKGESGIAMQKNQWLGADFDKLKILVRSLNLPTNVQCGPSQPG